MLNVEDIQALIKSVDESSIDEFNYETEETKLSVKKNTGELTVKPAQKVAEPLEKTSEQVVAPSPEKEEVTPQSEASVPNAKNSVDYDYEITSPMVGTLYSSPSPETDPYVQKGSMVQKDTVVCIVEAMKLFNEIEAEASGEIVEILVDDGELVEYNQPLFRVKTK